MPGRRREKPDRVTVAAARGNDALLVVTGFTPQEAQSGREGAEGARNREDGRRLDTPRTRAATILADGIPIRVTGEDVERGTFSQRHAVFHDAETGKVFVPLQEFAQARASFEIHNSPLSENGVIGFEVGYNLQEPDRLVIWEAQYGDSSTAHR